MNFAGVKILCIGDLMLDRFIYGAIERISPEAPVPVIRLREERVTLGGAGNVAHNIATLGGEAVLIGLLGEDDAARNLRRVIETIPRLSDVFVTTRLRPTITKTRYIAGSQQVVRTDEESSLPAQPSETDDLLAALQAHIQRANAVILSDYGKGVVVPRLVEATVRLATELGIPVFVDPKSEDFSWYQGVTCITPNLKELAVASRMKVDTEADIEAACRHLMQLARCSAILATRSEKGMMLVEANGETHSVPSRAREVFDVSGAGDTVIATMALAHASGLSLPQAMRISNAAAGVVVSKVGTATVEPAELLHELDESAASRPNGRTALRSLAETAELVERWKSQGLTVGFTNGCFDILHAGHVTLLAAARARCDRLVVALNGDASVRRLKGPTRPVNLLAQRSVVMAAIKYVDCVVSFDEDTPLDLITRLVPDVLIKGADYQVADVVGADVVQKAGGKVVLCDLVAGQSTSRMIERITVGAGDAVRQLAMPGRPHPETGASPQQYRDEK